MRLSARAEAEAEDKFSSLLRKRLRRSGGPPFKKVEGRYQAWSSELSSGS